MAAASANPSRSGVIGFRSSDYGRRLRPKLTPRKKIVDADRAGMTTPLENKAIPFFFTSNRVLTDRDIDPVAPSLRVSFFLL